MMTLMDHKTEIQNSVVVKEVFIILLRIIKDEKIILKGTFLQFKQNPKRNVMDQRKVMRFKLNIT